MPQRVTICVPATSANLGPGFDCLALALDLWNEATFIEQGDRTAVDIQGEGSDSLPTDTSNLIIRSFLEIYRRCGAVPPAGLLVKCKNQIPLGSGLGSSAAAVLTGIAGANTFLGAPLSRGEMLQTAADMEGHADNAAAALFGGLTLVTASSSGKILSRVLQCHPWHAVVVLPNFHLPTLKARQALPRDVPFKDAVFNLGHVLLTTEALRTGDITMLAAGFEDRLHQPYRLSLIPGADEALKAARKLRAAAALSGAGPSVIAFTNGYEIAIRDAMQQAFQDAGFASRWWILHSTSDGLDVA